MFNFSDQSNIIDKARRAAAKGEYLKAIKILQNALKNEPSDLPLILEIMHTYHAIDKLNEVIIWAEKGSSLSPEAKRKVLAEVEDLFYGRGKPDRLAEYLMEKFIERMDFEGVYDLFRDMGEESKNSFINREEKVVKNILENKKDFNQRDFTHLYLYALMNEGRKTEESLRIFKIIYEKKPEEIENIILELKRAERENYGDPIIKLGLGEFLLKNKQYPEAVSKLREVLNINPEFQEEIINILSPYEKDSKEIIDFLSELLIETGKEEEALSILKEIGTDDAIKKYQKLVKKDPQNPVVHKQLAEAYLEKQRYSEALREFLSALSISPLEEIGKRVKELEEKLPEELDNFFLVANIYKLLGWKEDLINIMKKAFEFAPSSSSVILENLNQLIEDKEMNVEGLLLKARLLSREGDTEGALKIYKELSLDPEKTELIKEELERFRKENPVSTEGEIISLMLQIPENPEEIAQRVNLIIGGNPNYIPVMLTEFDKRVKAKPEFTPQFLIFYKNLDRKNFPPFAYPFALAELYRIVEDFDKAEKYYKEAIDEVPERFNFVLTYLGDFRKNPKIRKLISSLYFHKGEFEKGCREMEVCAKEFPEFLEEVTSFLINEANKRNNKSISQTLTKILIQNNYFEEAIKWGSQVLSSLNLEEQPEIMLSLAKAYGKLGNLPEATSLVRRAVGIDGSLKEEAIEVLEEVRKEGFSDYDSLMTLYRLYRESNNFEKAISSLEEALSKKPTVLGVMEEECEKLIDIAPINAKIRIFYGKVKLLKGDLKGLEEIEKGVRFDPSLKGYAVESLREIKEPTVERKIVLFKASIEKGLGHLKEALTYFIKAYWENEEKRAEIIKEINELFPKVELSYEIVRDLIKIYANEERNAPIVSILESFFDGSKERGSFLLEELTPLFPGKIPLPIRIILVKIHSQIGNKKEAKEEMEKLLDEYPEVAEQLEPFVSPQDVEMFPILIKINIALSNVDKAIEFIKKLETKEQLPFYEKILEKNPEREDVVSEVTYLNYLLGNIEKAKFYGEKIKNPGKKEKVLLWFLGQEMPLSLSEIQEIRKEIIFDKIKIAESSEEKAYLYIKIKEYGKAMEEIEKLEGEKKEIILSLIEEELKNYWDGYIRLSKLENKDDYLERRALLAFYSGRVELALKLMKKFPGNPIKKKAYISQMIRESIEPYRKIKPLIRG
ncbi:MAG: tetratricopeptide repeat protein [candidate division WOR-3 bacterium]